MFRRVRTLSVVALSFGIFVAGTSAHAVPIDETDSHTSDGSTIEGSLHGDLDGNILTLNVLPPRSELRVDLADPDPFSLPSQQYSGAFCGGFNCTITMNLNGTVTPTLEPWRFRMGGSVEFDDQNPNGGVANLTAVPVLSTIGFISASTTPTFSVVAGHYDNAFIQASANLAASLTKGILNAGNWSLSADGAGTWDSIDLGTISAFMNEVADMTEVDLSFEDVMMSGIFSYDRDLDFDNSIIDDLGDALISLFRNSIDNALTGLLVGLFNDQINTVAPEFGYNCSATRRQDAVRAADVVCTLDQDFHFSIQNGPVAVSAPAAGGLFAMIIPAILLRRRRKQAAA